VIVGHIVASVSVVAQLDVAIPLGFDLLEFVGVGDWELIYGE